MIFSGEVQCVLMAIWRRGANFGRSSGTMDCVLSNLDYKLSDLNMNHYSGICNQTTILDAVTRPNNGFCSYSSLSESGDLQKQQQKQQQ